MTWCTDLAVAFREAGVTTTIANFRACSLAERWTQLTSKRRLLFNPTTCQRLAKILADFSPDLVLILNYPGLPADAATILRQALRPGVPVVGWLCDSVEAFPAGHEVLLDGLYYFDSASLPVLEKHYQGSRARLEFLPLAACPRRYACPVIDIRSRKPFLVFAGNCTPSRQAFFAAYRGLGKRLDLYGPHGGNWPRLWRNRKLSSADLARIYRGHLINLNLRQPGNTTNGLNLRAFEIPCAGGLATYPAVPDLPRCFTPNEEVLIYSSAEDLMETVRQTLRHPDAALTITRAGHQRVMREHTFYHRASRILGDWIGPSFQPNLPAYLAASP
ncbi:MAG: glycosyltransferase [Verrucomicrobia bacterium]|nr:glycosyltransferase [Verrucomicrobiota bacterium]